MLSWVCDGAAVISTFPEFLVARRTNKRLIQIFLRGLRPCWMLDSPPEGQKLYLQPAAVCSRVCETVLCQLIAVQYDTHRARLVAMQRQYDGPYVPMINFLPSDKNLNSSD